jgi:hypothetical protein
MRIHKLENCDFIKILPIIKNNGDKVFYEKYDVINVNGRFVYDNTGKNYLRKISRKAGLLGSPITTRYYCNIYICGEIRILNFTRTIMNLINNSLISDPNILDIRSNNHLFISKKDVTTSMGLFPSYDDSKFVKLYDWSVPVSDINSEQEWIKYIKDNQEDYYSYIDDNNIFNKKDLLIDHYGSDLLSELISDDREKKLNILIK